MIYVQTYENLFDKVFEVQWQFYNWDLCQFGLDRKKLFSPHMLVAILLGKAGIE